MSSTTTAAPATELAIKVDDLHVVYRSVLDKRRTLKGWLTRRNHRDASRSRKVHALRGVDVVVPRGSVLGVIGHNGAGKSTLLRAMAGILPPHEGRITVDGRVSTLLALGLGFNGNLTGRENILIGGLANGLTRRQIEEREEAIIEFAGVEEFIDFPMRSYSSGMRGRLAFAVATSMDPDILLVDEALSAGDADFKKRAQERMRELILSDRTIVLVSHGLASILELSDKVLWLDHGERRMFGDPEEVVNAYTDSTGTTGRASAHED